jgi:hypothetical protein
VGEWRVEVRGFNVPHGPQRFALVVNGALDDWPPGGFSANDERRESNGAAPAIFAQPNPSGGLTTIHYAVPSGYVGPVQLQIVDVSGRLVRSLVDKGQRGGEYQVTWDGLDDNGRAMSDGVYFAKIMTSEQTTAGKLVLQR